VEGREKSHNGKIKEIVDDKDYDASCTLTPVPVLDFGNVKCLMFVA
jgi:hypothetical protein